MYDDLKLPPSLLKKIEASNRALVVSERHADVAHQNFARERRLRIHAQERVYNLVPLIREASRVAARATKQKEFLVDVMEHAARHVREQRPKEAIALLEAGVVDVELVGLSANKKSRKKKELGRNGQL